jgi:hypothetical protein
MLMMLIYILWKHTYHKKNAEALVFASKENALAVNGEKTKNMFVFWEHNAEKYYNIKIANKSLVSR